MFLGNPSPDARKKWISKKALMCENSKNYLYIATYIKEDNNI